MTEEMLRNKLNTLGRSWMSYDSQIIAGIGLLCIAALHIFGRLDAIDKKLESMSPRIDR